MKPITKQEKQAIKLLVDFEGINNESELVGLFQKGKEKRTNAFFNPLEERNRLKIDKKAVLAVELIGLALAVTLYLLYFMFTYPIRIGWRLSELFWFRNNIKRNIQIYREINK